jgi:cysteinyl-tRNA synthetase
VGADVLAGPGDDPLAVRLALISSPYHQQADLTEGMLASAQETVAQWRRQVAGWAESPSRPVPARIAEVVRAAFGDLDTMSVLALLHDLTLDADVPAGAKFETFLYADRLLGLDLPSDIGRASS